MKKKTPADSKVKGLKLEIWIYLACSGWCVCVCIVFRVSGCGKWVGFGCGGKEKEKRGFRVQRLSIVKVGLLVFIVLVIVVVC